MRRLVGVCVVLMTIGAWGQDAAPVAPAAPSPTGTVTGRLTFAETQLPARFAEVVLVRVPDAADLELTSPEAHAPSPKKTPERMASVSGRSNLDGAYAIPEVPPGDYFAIAKMQGYVVPIGMPANKEDVGNIAKQTAQLPVIHVEANQISTIDLMLHRGGVISGRVAYQDGSPAVGATVQATPPGIGGSVQASAYMPLQFALRRNSPYSFEPMMGSQTSSTDDEGRFRISGLQAGKYFVATTVRMGGGLRMVGNSSGGLNGSPVKGNSESNMTIYEPGVLRQSGARVFEIRADERISDADITIDLNGLHTIRGKVLAKADRHVLSNVLVMLSEDAEKSFHKIGVADTDGSFHVDFVPPGTYTLMVAGDDFEVPATQMARVEDGPPQTRRRFERVKVPVIVGEHDVVLDDFLLVEAKDEGDDAP